MESGRPSDALALDATAVAFTEVDGVAILVMAERQDGGDTLEIQLARTFDDQDRRLRMDRHCLVLNGGAIYGAIDRWRASSRGLSLYLSAAASQELGTSMVRVTYDSRHASTVVTALRTLLPDDTAEWPT